MKRARSRRLSSGRLCNRKAVQPDYSPCPYQKRYDRRNAQDKAKEKELLEYKLEQQKSELEKSHYDELTGIYNKQWFIHELRRILDENPGKSYVIGRFDIDRFKVFNEIFGSSGGDRLLLEIANDTGP